jgi:hypothetical protein
MGATGAWQGGKPQDRSPHARCQEAIDKRRSAAQVQWGSGTTLGVCRRKVVSTHIYTFFYYLSLIPSPKSSPQICPASFDCSTAPLPTLATQPRQQIRHSAGIRSASHSAARQLPGLAARVPMPDRNQPHLAPSVWLADAMLQPQLRLAVSHHKHPTQCDECNLQHVPIALSLHVPDVCMVWHVGGGLAPLSLLYITKPPSHSSPKLKLYAELALRAAPRPRKA